MYVDANGNIYVAESDISGDKVCKWAFDSTSRPGEIVAGADAVFRSIAGVYVDKNGVIYIAALNNLDVWNIIRYIPGDNKGKPVFNLTESGLLYYNSVSDMKANSKGEFYIASTNTVIKWIPGDNNAILAEGNNTSGPAEKLPRNISRIYVDVNDAPYTSEGEPNCRIRKWESGATTSTTIAQSNATHPADLVLCFYKDSFFFATGTT